jgi:hypothetical protein
MRKGAVCECAQMSRSFYDELAKMKARMRGALYIDNRVTHS